MRQRHADPAHDQMEIPSDPALRVKALESLLVDKGLMDPAALDVLVDIYEHKVGPRNGAQVVARAWVDPAYKQRLLADGTAALAELGFSGGQGEQLTVVENTPGVHNVIVWVVFYMWRYAARESPQRLVFHGRKTLGVKLSSPLSEHSPLFNVKVDSGLRRHDT